MTVPTVEPPVKQPVSPDLRLVNVSFRQRGTEWQPWRSAQHVQYWIALVRLGYARRIWPGREWKIEEVDDHYSGS